MCVPNVLAWLVFFGHAQPTLPMIVSQTRGFPRNETSVRLSQQSSDSFSHHSEWCSWEPWSCELPSINHENQDHEAAPIVVMDGFFRFFFQWRFFWLSENDVMKNTLQHSYILMMSKMQPNDPGSSSLAISETERQKTMKMRPFSEEARRRSKQ